MSAGTTTGGAIAGMALISGAALMEWPITTWTLVAASCALLAFAAFAAWRDGGLRR